MALPQCLLVKTQVLLQALAVHAGTTHSSVIANESVIVAQLSINVTKIDDL